MPVNIAPPNAEPNPPKAPVYISDSISILRPWVNLTPKAYAKTVACSLCKMGAALTQAERCSFGRVAFLVMHFLTTNVLNF